MSERHNTQNIKVKAVSDSAPVWFIGWLFTIGFANLSVMQAIFAILLWPYYLGSVMFEVLQ